MDCWGLWSLQALAWGRGLLLAVLAADWPVCAWSFTPSCLPPRAVDGQAGQQEGPDDSRGQFAPECAPLAVDNGQQRNAVWSAPLIYRLLPPPPPPSEET